MYDFKRESPLKRKPIHSYRETKNNKIKVIDVLAKFSQIAMVLIVAFGYWYTVVPVMQKEELAENVSRLKIEQKEISSDLENKNENLKKAILKLSKIKEEKTRIEIENKDLSDYREKADAQLANMKNQRSFLESEIVSLKNAYIEYLKEELRNRSYIFKSSDKESDKITYSLNEIITTIPFASYSETTDITKRLRSEFEGLDPKKESQEILLGMEMFVDELDSGVEKSSRLEILAAARKNASQYQHLFKCTYPDYSKWDLAYKHAVKKSKENVDRCSKIMLGKYYQDQFRSSSIMKWIAEKSPVHIINEKEFSSACQSIAKSDVDALFIKRWGEIKSDCNSKISGVSRVLAGDTNLDVFNKDTETLPPHWYEVEGKISETLDTLKKVL